MTPSHGWLMGLFIIGFITLQSSRLLPSGKLT